MSRIGIDLGGTKIEGAVLGPDGRFRQRLRVPTPAGVYDATITAIADLVEQLERNEGDRCSVGVGIPGSVSPTTGLVRNANSTCLIGRPVERDLGERLARPVRLANDADCFALSEAHDGAGQNAAVVFGVIVGTGTGGGIVIDRQLLQGTNRIAGEWGHNPLPWPRPEESPGPLCYCGQRGCIETFLSGPALAGDFGDGKSGRSAAQVVDLAARGDAAAQACMDRYHDRMARALASVINLLDPQVIVLGGGLSQIDSLYEAVPRRWPHYVFSDSVGTRLVPPQHGDSSGVRGAAWLWPES